MRGLDSDPRTIVPLDGTWQLKMDPRNLGKRKQWHAATLRSASPMLVPSCWNEKYPDYDRGAWYETEFAAPLEWKEKHVTVKFEAVNYFAEVWVNGKHVGQHEGGYTPFELDIGSNLNPEAPNRLTVRVVDSRSVLRGAGRSGFSIDLEVLSSAESVVHRESRKASLRPLLAPSSRWQRLFEVEPIAFLTGECRDGDGRFTIRMRVRAVNGSDPIVEGTDTVWVFDNGKTRLPSSSFFVIDPEESITPWLEGNGAAFQSLQAGSVTAKTPRFVVVGRLSRDSSIVKALPDLVRAREIVRSGGTALLLQSLPRNLKNILFRNELWTKDCKGLLVGALQYAKPHPVVFRDLPHGALGREYASILPDENLKEHNFPPGSEVIAGSFSCEGGGFAFQASIAVIPEGKGRYVFSQFKLAENLGKDPLADRLFCNLVNYGLSLEGEVAQRGIEPSLQRQPAIPPSEEA